MGERDGRQRFGRDDDARAETRHGEQPLGECVWQADAAVRRRITRQGARVERDTRPGQPLHERHRRAGVDVALVVARFLDDAEDAGRRAVALLAARNRGLRYPLGACVEGHALAIERDDAEQRLDGAGHRSHDGLGLRLGAWARGVGRSAVCRAVFARPAGAVLGVGGTAVVAMASRASATDLCQPTSGSPDTRRIWPPFTQNYD